MPSGPIRAYSVVAGLQPGELQRAGADDHQDQGDGAPLAVEIGDGQRDALAALVGHDDDELAGLGLAGDPRRIDHQLEDLWRKFLRRGFGSFDWRPFPCPAGKVRRAAMASRNPK